MRLSRANMPLASGYGAWCQALSGFHCKNLAPHFPPGFINLQYFCHSRWRNPVRLSKSGLSRAEALHFLGCVEDIKHHAILTTCYAAGLRISEAVRLKTSSLDN